MVMPIALTIAAEHIRGGAPRAPGAVSRCLYNFKQRRRQPLHFAVRHSAITLYVCYGKIYRVRSGTASFRLSLIAVPHRTYRVGAADISLLRGSYVRLSHYHICAKCCVEWLLFCSCGVYRGAAARCPRKNIVSCAAEHTCAFCFCSVAQDIT